MKAFVVHAPGQSTIEEVESPVAKPGHVVIDIARAGVCGTDVEFLMAIWLIFKPVKLNIQCDSVTNGVALYQVLVKV